MEFSILIIVFVVWYIFYSQALDDTKKISRENEFKDYSKLHPDLKSLIEQNNKIGAIKAYRKIYSSGLEEANDVICRHLPN